MLKLKLWRIENVVLMKVLEQDEELRGKLEYEADNGVGLYSDCRPDLSGTIVYMRGEGKEYDSEVSCECHDSIRDAKEQIQKIREAVNEFNQQYKPSTDEEPDDIEVFIAE